MEDLLMAREPRAQRLWKDIKSGPRQRWSPLLVERLEDRTVPASVFWDGGGDGVNWGSAANWSNDALPTAADDVTINAPPGVTVQVGSFVGATCNSLQSQNSITLSGGNLTVATPSSINGTLTVAGVFSTLTANGDLSVTNLVHSNGTLTGPATVTISGAWTWTNGSQTGPGRTVNNGTGTVSGGFFTTLNGRTVDNSGTVTAATDGITLSGNAVWNNLASGTVVLQGNASLGGFFPSAVAGFNNAGVLRRSGAIGSSSVGVAVNNLAGGTVDVQTGTLTLSGGGSSAGSFTIASGATLNAGT